MALEHYDIKEKRFCVAVEVSFIVWRTGKVLEVLKARLFSEGKWNLVRNSGWGSLKDEKCAVLLKACAYRSFSHRCPLNNVALRSSSRLQTQMRVTYTEVLLLFLEFSSEAHINPPPFSSTSLDHGPPFLYMVPSVEALAIC